MTKLKERLKSLIRTEKPTAALTTCIVIAVIVLLNVIAFTLTAAFGLYAYSPEYSDLTISGKTDSVFTGISLGKEVTVTFCMEEAALRNSETGSFVWSTATQLAERYSFIKLKYVNMLTKRDERGELFDFERYRTDMKGNEVPIRQNSVIFTQGANHRVLTDTYTSAGFADFFSMNSSGEAYAYNGEEILVSMIAWVLRDEHKTAYLTEKHGESVDVNFVNMLTCAGYYVETLNLRDREVPSDAGLVVISNPTSDFYRLEQGSGGRSEIERLESYLLRGGNLYVTVDPLVKQLPILEGFLAEWGLEIVGMKNDSGVFSRAMVKNSDLGITTDGYSFVTEYAGGNISSNIKSLVTSYTDSRVLLGRAAAIKTDPALGASPLLLSGDGSELSIFGERVKDEETPDGGYAVVAASERENEDGSYAKILLVPSAYMLAADAVTSDRYSNKDYVYATLYSFFGADAAPLGCRTVTYDNTILENFTMRTARAMTALVLSVPAAIAVTGAVIIIKRKNR